MRRFVLRECFDFFVLIGTDKTFRRQQILKINKKQDTDLMAKDYNLTDIIEENRNTYDEESFEDFLLYLKGKHSPVTTRVNRAYGILGFVKFLKGYYLVLITSRQRICKIG
jgi:hypothetical protein